mmetsp:Transcript_32972/g.48802  ORF Transcript_32972/g.48802 Transcript_32972/m.48802 type:complete len:477 (-) Transcript_32972:24-1454(-)|eukprot:CAMPEP_0194026802 /NCGR_PEP_ID=MMETSP0009_2-20130614/1066_1 /TAXON_ID=210454 /ORGANISM="Grammatophora oceanica, Strain CCMP 410" /LENGTH=476 /DNA_ID=CAMNT_0038665663 /DNA_START=22 /DNA_END=1452 /DNA_ORIENTATION=-
MRLTVAVFALFVSCIGAFAPSSSASRRRSMVPPIRLSGSVALKVATIESSTTGAFSPSSSDQIMTGAMGDLTGIAFSGLKGKALSWRDEDFPKSIDVKKTIPAECFEPDTTTSMAYLAFSLAATAACTAVGVGMLSLCSPSNPFTWPLWAAYAAVTGTAATGLWVVAHECGHGAFSKNKRLQDVVGYTLHSLLLVPYFSWQRSHAVHHQYTNNLELGETHVPEQIPEENGGSSDLRKSMLDKFGTENGLKAFGALQGFLHLIVGWPAYLLWGATGGGARGMTNHFFPDPLTEPDIPSKELFPGDWKQKVVMSDIGIAAVVGGLVAWTFCNGLPQMMALYGGPYLVVNVWLVLYTWLQHTDVDVPHFSMDKHSFMKGAFHTIDRPYDKLDPWGIIDFLHHKIGTTHVAHHFDSRIPHYKAQMATDAIRQNFPELYLYDPTPVPEALWRICRGCTAVEQRDNRWIWNNEGLEEKLQKQ